MLVAGRLFTEPMSVHITVHRRLAGSPVNYGGTILFTCLFRHSDLLRVQVKDWMYLVDGVSYSSPSAICKAYSELAAADISAACTLIQARALERWQEESKQAKEMLQKAHVPEAKTAPALRTQVSSRRGVVPLERLPGIPEMESQ